MAGLKSLVDHREIAHDCQDFVANMHAFFQAQTDRELIIYWSNYSGKTQLSKAHKEKFSCGMGRLSGVAFTTLHFLLNLPIDLKI